MRHRVVPGYVGGDEHSRRLDCRPLTTDRAGECEGYLLVQFGSTIDGESLGTALAPISLSVWYSTKAWKLSLRGSSSMPVAENLDMLDGADAVDR